MSAAGASATPQNVPFDVDGARAAGYSDSAIADFLASQTNFDIGAARKAGYGDDAIIGHIATKPVAPPAPSNDYTTGWSQLKGAGVGLINASAGALAAVPRAVESLGENVHAEMQQEDATKAKILSAFDAIDDNKPVPKNITDSNGAKINPAIFGRYVAADADERAAIRNSFSSESPAAGGLLDQAGQDLATGGGAVAAPIEKAGQWVDQHALSDAERGSFSVKAAEMIGGIVPLVGASLAGDVPALMGVAGLQGYDEGYQNAKNAGQSDGDAATAGYLNGLANAGLMAVPVHKAMEVLDKLPALARNSTLRAVTELAKSSATMVGFSQLSTIADNAVAKATYDPGRDMLQGVGKDIGEQALVGALVPVGGAAVGMAGRAAARALTPEQKATPVLEAGSVDEAIDEAIKSLEGPPQAEQESAAAPAPSEDVQARADQQDKLLRLFNGLNSGTVERADDGTYSYTPKGAPATEASVPLQVWEPPAEGAEPDPGAISADLARTQVDHYGQLGIDVVYFRNDPRIPFDGAVDPDQPNTIFLSNDPSRNAAQVAAHEVTHVLESTKMPDGINLGDVLKQQVLEGITNEGWQYAARLFGDTAPNRNAFEPGPAGDAEHADAIVSHLVTELGADIGSEAPKFADFATKVTSAVEDRYGIDIARTTLQRFMDGIKAAFDTIRSFFKGDEATTVSQNLVTNLADIHQTLAKMYAAKYGDALAKSELADMNARNEAAKAGFHENGTIPEGNINTINSLIGAEGSLARGTVARETPAATPVVTPAPPEAPAAPTLDMQRVATLRGWLRDAIADRAQAAAQSPQGRLLRQSAAALIMRARAAGSLSTEGRARLEVLQAAIHDREHPAADTPEMARLRDAITAQQQRIGGMKFSPRVTGATESEDRPAVFYSALERGIDGLKMDRAPPAQWEGTIRNMPGVKAEELGLSGVTDWLHEHAKPISKAEVLNHVREHGTQLNEILKRYPGDYTGKDVEALARDIAREDGYDWDEIDGGLEQSFLRVARQRIENDGAQFREYTLPGGENYHELLLQLKRPEAPDNWTTRVNDEETAHAGHEMRDVVDTNGNVRATLPADDVADYMRQEVAAGAPSEKPYRSRHWDEPNILVHARFDDRRGPDGQRILHVGEIQSDLHQQGRREGYRPSVAELSRMLNRAKDLSNEAVRLRAEYRDAQKSGADDLLERLQKVHATEEAAQDAQKSYADAKTFSVPDAPFKTTWPELMMKRLLRYAAEHGYDRVSWDTGDTNADRYDLSKRVRAINWKKPGDGKIHIVVEDLNGQQSIKRDVEPKELADLIGKTAADKIIGDENKAGKLAGEGLKVGGEGMRAFYDKMLPSFVNRYVKKWGAKVEAGEIPDREKSGFMERYYDGPTPTQEQIETQAKRFDGNATWSNLSGQLRAFGRALKEGKNIDDAARQIPAYGAELFGGNIKERPMKLPGHPVHIVTITPSMREAVLGGQPLFSPRVRDRTKEVMDAVPGLKRVAANMKEDELGPLMKRTAEKLVRLFKDAPDSNEMASIAYSGRAKRGWYQHSGQAIAELFGSEDAPRFTALLAALSPQTSVESNLENAARTWTNWNNAGRPTDPNEIIKIMGRSVQGTGGDVSVLDAWKGNTVRALTHPDPANILLSGPKVNSFAANLRGVVDEVTNDAWMATYSGMDPETLAAARRGNPEGDTIGKSFGYKSPGYIAMSARAREAANILTRRTGQKWTPAEVQETVWSWVKTLYERRDRAGEDRTAQQILKAADLTHEDINSTPDFASLLIGGIYRKILEEGGYRENIQELERSQVGRAGAGEQRGPAISVTSAEGSGIAQPAFERHLQAVAGRIERVRNQRLAEAGIDTRDLAKKARESEISANLSAATNSIPGIRHLVEAANAGDESAGRLVNLIAHESIERLVGDIPGVKLEVTENGGLYGGSLEPSIGLKLHFPEKVLATKALAGLARFARNFNQEQIHVRQDTLDPPGRVSTDGSYSTAVYTFDLVRPLGRDEIQQVIADSGLYGVTFNAKQIEAYFVGNARDASARAEFDAAIIRARESLGERIDGFRRSSQRLWAYGEGEGATQGYPDIDGHVPAAKEQFTRVPRAIAERALGREVEPAAEAPKVTEGQAALQRRIAADYDALPDNDLQNPAVAKAYREMVEEVGRQYDRLPIKVDVWADRDADGNWQHRQGEPYKSSADMRRDVLDNNHLWIYGTTPETFGPPGEDFSGHPLLEETGRESSNGYPMLANDELRAVHDYYAHLMSPVRFGPTGEEAAWRNHLATIENPWARWALTSETRGQNSWVNFGAHVEPGTPLRDRPFARQKAALLPIEDTLTGNDVVDLPVLELMRELPRGQQRGSLPEEDAFAQFSPRISREVAEWTTNLTISGRQPEPKVQTPSGSRPEPEAAKRRLSMPNPEGKGGKIERGLNEEATNALENEDQMARAKRLVDRNYQRAIEVAMRERQPPEGILPTFVYFEVERRATQDGDTDLIRRLAASPLAEEVTTAGRVVQSFATRDPNSAVARIQGVQRARENAVAARGKDITVAKEVEAEKAATEIRKEVKKQIAKRPPPLDEFKAFIQSIKCN